MDDQKILLIAHTLNINDIPVNTGNSFIRTFINNNALYLDYIELYGKYGFYGIQNYIEEYIKKHGINSVLICAGPREFYFDVNYIEKLRKNNFLAMVPGDAEIYFEVSSQYYAQAMDLVIVPNFITTFKVRQLGIDSISYWAYFDTTLYRKIENLPKDIDVSFVGSLDQRQGRRDYVKYLSDNGINIQTFGYDSPGGKITDEKKIEIINRSKINLDLCGQIIEKGLTRKHQINKRKKQIIGKCFEAATCGSFALAEYAPLLEHFFEIEKENGKEIDVFKTKEELLEKVRYYLKNEEERENIAKRGYQRSIKEYDVKLAVPDLIAKIDGFRKKKVYRPQEICLDEEFTRNYATFRWYLILRFIKSGKWKFVFEELKIIFKYGKFDWYQFREFTIEFFNEEILFFKKHPEIKSVFKLFFKRKKNIAQ